MKKDEQYTFGKITYGQFYDGYTVMPTMYFPILLDGKYIGHIDVRLVHTLGERPGVAAEARVVNYITDEGFDAK